MNTTITPISGTVTQVPAPFAAITSADTTRETTPSTGTPYIKAAASTDTNAYSDATQHQQVIQQASSAAAFNYPLGDKEFTVFKDQSGQYITRYVSLRDGSITYIPEPALVRHTQVVTGNASNPALVALSA